jgi:hypothetical protein
MGLTFYDDFPLLISKVEVVQLPSIDADFKCPAGGQVQALLSKEILSLGLKITTDLCIAFCFFVLEWFIHAVSLQ